MNIKTIWPHALAAATLVVGYIVSLVPEWSKESKLLIVIGAIVFSAAILLADAIRNKPAGQTIVTTAKDDIEQALATVDFGPIVQKELTKLLGANQASKPATPA